MILLKKNSVKKMIFLVIFFSMGQFVIAQETVTSAKSELDISFYTTDIGKNIAVDFNKNFKNYSILIGIKSHINESITLSGQYGHLYHNQFFADNVMDYIGASLGCEYHLRNINPYVTPYVLFNVQFANMKTKYMAFSNKKPSGSEYIITSNGPFLVFENTIGLGLSIKLNERFSINESAGFGMAFFYNQHTQVWDYETMYQWRAGLSIKLN